MRFCPSCLHVFWGGFPSSFPSAFPSAFRSGCRSWFPKRGMRVGAPALPARKVVARRESCPAPTVVDRPRMRRLPSDAPPHLGSSPPASSIGLFSGWHRQTEGYMGLHPERRVWEEGKATGGRVLCSLFETASPTALFHHPQKCRSGCRTMCHIEEGIKRFLTALHEAARNEGSLRVLRRLALGLVCRTARTAHIADVGCQTCHSASWENLARCVCRWRERCQTCHFALQRSLSMPFSCIKCEKSMMLILIKRSCLRQNCRSERRTKHYIYTRIKLFSHLTTITSK